MTTNHIEDYWVKNHIAYKNTYPIRPRVTCPVVTCADGFTMSVQASYTHYCSPRDYIATGNYNTWEVGFPSEKEDLLMDWIEEPDNPTDTVYGYVPTEVINEVIEKHGGIV